MLRSTASPACDLSPAPPRIRTESPSADDCSTRRPAVSSAARGARTTIAPAQTASGANGAALIVDTDLVNHGGTGGEPATCVWVAQLADAIPGVITVARYRAELANGSPCP